MSQEQVAHPANKRVVAIFVVGLWLFFAPGFLKYGGEMVMTLATVFSGLVLCVLGGIALRKATAWKLWTSGVLGAWLILMPWLVGFASVKQALINSLACGVIVLAAVAVELYVVRGRGPGGAHPAPL